MTCKDHGKKGNHHGYATTWHCGKNEKLHRVAYCAAKQVSITSIAGLLIRHTCDNPRCVNPDHLVVGTQKDNMLDKRARQREPGRKLTQEDAVAIRSLYVSGHRELGQTALARRYGVSQPVMSKLLRGLTY